MVGAELVVCVRVFYNAVPEAAVDTLVSFIAAFEKRYG
jgi:phosphoserine aminotransferase